MSEGAFECKVERRSENTKGIFITLLINPADHDEALSQVRVGAALQIGWAEIVDSGVQPLTVENIPDRNYEAITGVGAFAPKPKPKQRFSEMSLPAQAGMLCDDQRFVEWLKIITPREHWDIANGDTASVLRNELGIASRTELSTDKNAGNRWRAMMRQYDAWALEQQYADSVRR